jgi:hypothetical protein
MEGEFHMECASSFEFLSRDGKIKLYERLVEKVANVKTNDEMNYDYKERKTGRQSADRSDTSHRNSASSEIRK